jgi:hypothetical protein
MSQREAAEALGVSRGAIEKDLASFKPESGFKEATDRNERTKQKQAARLKREENLALKTPKGSYGVIYADPSWKFEVYSGDTGQGRTGRMISGRTR